MYKLITITTTGYQIEIVSWHNDILHMTILLIYNISCLMQAWSYKYRPGPKTTIKNNHQHAPEKADVLSKQSSSVFTSEPPGDLPEFAGTDHHVVVPDIIN